MASKDDEFKPRLGKMRAKGKGSFRGQVLHAVHRAGGTRKGGARFVAKARLGRGRAVVGIRPKGSRRVVIKARFTRLAGKGLGAARAHLKYLQRDGTTRDGQAGALYDRDSDRADGKAFLDTCADDRHLFRIIVAPEDSDQYDDLKGLTRRLMTQMEKDLGTRLEWVAVDHFNTGHPHTHIAIRGRDDQGQDLIMARDYISNGIRARAEALVTLDLGPQTEHEVTDSLRREIDQPRRTRIDRQLLRDRGADQTVTVRHGDAFQQSLRAGRLQTLGAFGLAEDMGGGLWRLSPDMEPTLRQMGARGDIIKSLTYDLSGTDLRHAALHLDIRGEAPTIIGEVLRRGELDDFGERQYLAVAATDGRVHVFDTGRPGPSDGTGTGTVVRVVAVTPELKPADHTIFRVAASNGGIYDIEAHLRVDPSATDTFAQTHVRRLEAIRRTTGGVQRSETGSFVISPSYGETALNYERHQARLKPVQIERLSSLPLERLPQHPGLTWLDRDQMPNVSDAGFGGRVGQARVARAAWLASEGLGVPVDGRQVLSPTEREGLRRREWEAIAGGVATEVGKPYVAARQGERVEGNLSGYRDTAEGRLAVIERARDFTLVPWRPVLEPHVGKVVSGVLDRGAINWSIGRSRGRGVE
ncbi:DUF3363 domain-containing protein [Asticcacaulis sp. YBE204]|uniref:DUF3363 domain-containing protein n=1 Tax=Asticcacaulis sp. YBE204 TaxID=1282363 RepID=UPI0003C3D3B1|nr:DUF3363 domain-containing protein [Asticcacaulis sp. YBE204]ESQ78691.1 hypothetical protein AEYBE204_11950 [Asticcacaulis sp. YBE204]